MKKNNLSFNVVMQTILIFANVVTPLISGMYITRVLSVYTYGIYNYINAFVSFGIVIGSLAIGTIGLRELSKVSNNEKINTIFSELFFLRLIFELLTFIFCIFIILFFNIEYKIIYIIMLLQMITKIFEVEWALTAINEFGFITLKTIIVKILYIFGLFIFVRNPKDLLNYALISVAIGFINEFSSFIYITKFINIRTNNINIFRYFKSVFIMTLTFNVISLYTNIDKVFLSNFVNSESVSYYSIVNNISLIIVSLIYGIVNGTLPHINNLLHKNIEEYKTMVKKVSNLYFFLAIPLSFGLAVLSKEVLTIYSGEKYSHIGNLLVISCIYALSLKYTEIYETLIIYPNKKERAGLIIFFVCGVLNVLSNIILVYFNSLSPFTTLLASIINNIIMMLLYIIYIKKYIKINVYIITKEQFRYMIISSLFFIISFITRLYINNFYLIILLVILFSVLIYYLLNLLFNDKNLEFYLNKMNKININKIL